MPQVDPELFDRGQFQAELALKSSPIAAFKKAIRQFREVSTTASTAAATSAA